MDCPYCGSDRLSVLESRDADYETIRRRRKCLKCKKRFTTYERTDFGNITVIKKDNSRQRFEREKILSGIMKACEKRPVSRETMDQIVDKIERKIRSDGTTEITTSKIGDMVIKELLKVDQVAYIRFASVYKQFESPKEFISVISIFKGSKAKK